MTKIYTIGKLVYGTIGFTLNTPTMYYMYLCDLFD